MKRPRGVLRVLLALQVVVGVLVTVAPAAPAAVVTRTLTLSKTSLGGGAATITSQPSGISCGDACSSQTASFAAKTPITLTAVVADGHSVRSWTGCTPTPGNVKECKLTLSGNTSVSVTLAKVQDLAVAVTSDSGTGSISGPGIACGGLGTTCAATAEYGSTVTLTASPDAGAMLGTWTGDAATCGNAGTCAVTMNGTRTVGATFVPLRYSLGVTASNVGGGGSGSVTSSVADVVQETCTGACSTSYAPDTVVSLAASPSEGSRFVRWTGDAAGCGTTATCSVTMSGARAVTAEFVKRWSLTATSQATGDFDGTVACTVGSTPVSCSGTFDHGTTVQIAATPDAGAALGGWSGDTTCAVTSTTCSVAMTADRTVTATFREIAYLVTVTRTSLGGGNGTITMTLPDDSTRTCGLGCPSIAEWVSPGGTVDLSVEVATGSEFTGWSGAGSGTCTATALTCSVTVGDAPISFAAAFEAPQRLLVAKAGTGTGAVTGTGIDCGADCEEWFDYGTSGIVLTATPSADNASRVTAWSIKTCGTATTCTVPSMTSARTVTVTFSLPTVSLTLRKTSVDSGTGSVSSSPAGISCSSTCTKPVTANFALSGGNVLLTASPTTSSSYFVRWEGDCASIDAQGRCVVDPLLNDGDPLTVTAVFGKTVLRLSKSLQNGATGGVSSTPKGISCGTSCASASYPFTPGTSVTLTPTAGTGSVFVRWAGCDSVTGSSCAVLMSEAKSVTAVFGKGPLVTVALSGQGYVYSSGSSLIDCGAVCATTVPSGSSLVLVATASFGWEFVGWTGPCTVDPLSPSVCTVTPTSNMTVTATFRQLSP